MLDFRTWTAPGAHLLIIGRRYDILKFRFALIFCTFRIYVYLNLSTCLSSTVSDACLVETIGFCSRMQNSILGNYRDAAARGKLWNPKNNWEHCSPSSRLLRAICIVRSGWLAAIDRPRDLFCPLISKWQWGDNSQVTDLTWRNTESTLMWLKLMF